MGNPNKRAPIIQFSAPSCSPTRTHYPNVLYDGIPGCAVRQTCPKCGVHNCSETCEDCHAIKKNCECITFWCEYCSRYIRSDANGRIIDSLNHCIRYREAPFFWGGWERNGRFWNQ